MRWMVWIMVLFVEEVCQCFGWTLYERVYTMLVKAPSSVILLREHHGRIKNGYG